MIARTRSPWEFDDTGKYYIKGVVRMNGVIVATIPKVTAGLTKEEREGNARLIAAAPELLEALESASTGLADLSGFLADRHAVVLNGIRDTIDAAIAKAEGQPSHA